MDNRMMLIFAGGLLCMAAFVFAPKTNQMAQKKSLSACACQRPRPGQPPRPTTPTEGSAVGMSSKSTSTKVAACGCQRPRPQQPAAPASVDPYGSPI